MSPSPTPDAPREAATGASDGADERPTPPTDWVVAKFGGTSVATVDGWKTIAAHIRRVRAEGHRIAVVCSAVAGASDTLERALSLAEAGDDVSEPVAWLRTAHDELAAAMGVDLPAECTELLDELEQGLEGCRMLQEASPRTRARMMSFGELMSTRLGVAWLQAQGIDVHWADARRMLAGVERGRRSEGQHYLSSSLRPERSAEAQDYVAGCDAVVTQGFIASDTQDDTVLLGRGGSDTSAAYLGALLAAERVEIWTDVPGLFTANPNVVPTARHIAHVGYDEAAAMASLGASVLHPRCLEPVARHRIPLWIRCTYEPENAGTVIDSEGQGVAGLKAVTCREGLVHYRMCRPRQWQPVGFVADVSACFKEHHQSIDLMCTSPSTLAVTVDPAASPATERDGLLVDLDEVCDVEDELEVDSISLVGTEVRDHFDRLGGILGLLQGVGLVMVVQGAADHHLTFVVEAGRADELVRRLHSVLFDGNQASLSETPLRSVRVSA